MRDIVGHHLGNEGEITALDWEILALLPPTAVTWLPNYGWHSQPIGADELRRILRINPYCHFIPRPYVDPGRFGDREHPNYDFVPAWLEEVKRLMDELCEYVPMGQRHMQIFNEQNMPRWSQWEGFGPRESDIRQFNEVFCFCYDVLKAHNPTFNIGFTPLTPGNHDAHFKGDPQGEHYYMHGPEVATDDLALKGIHRNAAIASCLCRDALMRADEYYAHIYVRPMFGLTAQQVVYELWGGQRYLAYASYFPKPMDIWITECGVTHDGTAIAVEALLDWVTLLASDPMVRGLTFWILGEHWHGLWYKDGRPHPVVYGLRDLIATLPELPAVDASYERYMGDLMQRHVIPVNLEAWFHKYARDEGLGERISPEIHTPSKFTLSQVFYTEPDDMQHVVCALVEEAIEEGQKRLVPLDRRGNRTSWRGATWHFDRPN